MPVTVSHLFKDPSTVTCMYDSRLMYHNFPTAPLTSSPPPECSVCDPAKMLGQNHFAEPNPHVLTFLLPIFFCRAELGLQEKEETKLKWPKEIQFLLLLLLLFLLSFFCSVLSTWNVNASCMTHLSWMGLGPEIMTQMNCLIFLWFLDYLLQHPLSPVAVSSPPLQEKEKK